MSFIATAILFVIITETVGFLYDLRHPQFRGQDDLGLGLLMVFVVIVTFLCVVPLVFPFYKFFSKRISQIIWRINDGRK
jgi:hypothetical protein